MEKRENWLIHRFAKSGLQTPRDPRDGSGGTPAKRGIMVFNKDLVDCKNLSMYNSNIGYRCHTLTDRKKFESKILIRWGPWDKILSKWSSGINFVS